jgi:hypothetical protein
VPGYWMPLTTNEAPVDPQIPFEIGRIIMRWSRVEEAFESDIDLLSKHPRAAKLLPTSIPNVFRRRLELWYRLVGAAFPDVSLYLTAATEIRDAAIQLATLRNSLTHGWVTVERGLIRIVDIKRSGRIRTMTVADDIEPSVLANFSNQIKRLEDEVLAFSLNHFWMKTHLVKPKHP